MQLSWAGVDHWVVSLGCGLLIGLVSERRGSEREHRWNSYPCHSSVAWLRGLVVRRAALCRCTSVGRGTDRCSLLALSPQ
jgi:hypothetical protein